MKPTKAYIVRVKTLPKSVEYAKVCSDSCDLNNMQWEYLDWFDGNKSNSNEGWEVVVKNGLKMKQHDPRHRGKARSGTDNKAQCITSAHARLWQMTVERNEATIIFEHDAVLLQPIELDIPDGQIVVLGYKLNDYKRYNSWKAGLPTEIIPIEKHEGAHAYAITPKTAQLLLDELSHEGVRGAIDNIYFLKSRKSKIPLSIMSPTPAIGWLRDSTIWNKSSNRNYDFIPSFKQNLL